MDLTQGVKTVVLAACVSALAGCLEIETTTTVHPDGTIRRVVRTSGDSAEVQKDHGIFVADTSWTVATRRTDSTYESVATRDFPDVRAFQAALDRGGDRALRVRVSFEKHFAWFTTSFEYRETILCYNQIHAIPLSDYIPPRDQESLIRHEIEKAPYGAGEDSVRLHTLSERTEEWDRRNKFEEYHRRFMDGAKWLPDDQLTALLTPAVKETLFARTANAMNAGNVDTLPSIYASVLKVPGVQKVFEHERLRFEEFARALGYQEEMLMSGYKRAAIVMPGILTETNGRSIEGNRVVWEDFLAAAYVTDYTMWARSRVVNWWAVVLTGGVVLVLAGLPLAAMLRNRRKMTAVI